MNNENESNKYETYDEINKAYNNFRELEREKKTSYKKDKFDNYLKDLGISIEELSSLNKEDRREFLINKIKEVLFYDFKELEKKNNKKMKKRLLENKYNKSKFQKRNKKNIYHWFNLRSKYSNIKGILTSRIIQLIGQNDNYVKLENLINEFENNKFLTNIDEFKSSIIFKTNHTNNFNNIVNINNKEYKNNYKEVNLIDYENEIMTNRLNSDKIKNFEWNKEIEDNFLTQRNLSKNLFSKKVKVAKYNDCSLAQFIKNFKNNDTQKDQRELLLENYLNGHFLSTQDLRFLAYTSESLNMFLDKKFYKKALSMIDRSVIDEIELKIALKILEDYNILKNELINKRKKYYKVLIKKKKKNFIYKQNPIGNDINLYHQRKMQKLLKKKILQKKKITINKDSYFDKSNWRDNDKKFINIFPKQAIKLTDKMKKFSSKLCFNYKKMRNTYSCGPLLRNHYIPKNKFEIEKATVIIQKNIRTKFSKNLRSKWKQKKDNKLYTINQNKRSN